MSTVADRTRAAMDAITSQVYDAPPLRLPPPPAPASRWRWRAAGSRRRWGTWLAPLAAAAAVIAVAISLVAVKGTLNGKQLPPTKSAGAPVSFPDYYLTFSQPVSDETVPVALELRQTLTGKTLFTLRPPRGLSFAGITGAADDRTFVADAHRDPYGAFNSGGQSRTWYLVRVTGSGARASLTMTRLPVPATPAGTEILAIALSPGGTKLAVGTAPWTTDTTHSKQALTVYSLATGAVLRTWTTPPGRANWALMSGGEGGADPNTGVAWVGNHALAFAGAWQTARVAPAELAVRVLDISRPDGDLLGSSRLATQVPTEFGGSDRKTSFGCDPSWRVNVLVTGDGTSFVCGGYGTSRAALPESLCGPGTAWNTVGFAGFSLATGQRRFLSGYRTTCQGLSLVAYAVWVNATGSQVIGWMHFADSVTGKFGVFSNGSFRPLPIPVPGNFYQWDDGSLLYQVAWQPAEPAQWWAEHRPPGWRERMATVGLLHPGEMGAAVGGCLVTAGHTVLWDPAGRSRATTGRALAAELTGTGLDAVVSRSSVILSVCPPHAALDVARQVAATGFGGVYVDANAISVATAARVAAVVTAAGAAYVDGGIIGPPPENTGRTRLYLCGERAAEVRALFARSALDARIAEGAHGEPYAASAVKMAYAAWTKGTGALLLACRALARAEGVERTLLEEWGLSQPALRAQSERSADAAAAKGWRWVAEMEEIAASMAAAGLPPEFHQAAAEIFDRASHADEPGAGVTSGAGLDTVLTALT